MFDACRSLPHRLKVTLLNTLTRFHRRGRHRRDNPATRKVTSISYYHENRMTMQISQRFSSAKEKVRKFALKCYVNVI